MCIYIYRLSYRSIVIKLDRDFRKKLDGGSKNNAETSSAPFIVPIFLRGNTFFFPSFPTLQLTASKAG